MALTPDERTALVFALANGLSDVRPGDWRDTLPLCTDEELETMHRLMQRANAARQVSRLDSPIWQLTERSRLRREEER